MVAVPAGQADGPAFRDSGLAPALFAARGGVHPIVRRVRTFYKKEEGVRGIDKRIRLP